jgi:TPR repeat protein
VKFKETITFLFAFISSLLLSSCGTSTAQQLQNGEASFTSGDFKSAFHQLLPLAAEGIPQAEYGVGYMYYYGYGIIQDSESGLFWMKKAARAQYKPAIRALAAIQENMSKVPPTLTPKKAEKLEEVQSFPSDTLTNTFVNSPSSKYTLQLMGSYYLAPLKKQQLLLNLNDLVSIKQTKIPHNGRDWYVLIYGNYTSLSAAELAKFDLPQKIKNFHPWTRKQDELKIP